MADLSITATSVVTSSGTGFTEGTAGETITAGQLVYLSATDSKLYKSDANGTSEKKTVLGVALNGGAVGQPIEVQTSGEITIGATVTVGTIYVMSATAGGICPAADLASGHTVSVVGVGKTSAILKLNIFNSACAVP